MDTHYISKVYMQRPQTHITMDLGMWFCNALNLDDPELRRANTASAKDIMIEKGYTSIPNLLDVLKEYNLGISACSC